MHIRHAGQEVAVHALLKQGGHLKTIGGDHIFPQSVDPIVIRYAKLASEICRDCPARIFPQCHVALPNGEPRVDEIGRVAEPPRRD